MLGVAVPGGNVKKRGDAPADEAHGRLLGRVPEDAAVHDRQRVARGDHLVFSVLSARPAFHPPRKAEFATSGSVVFLSWSLSLATVDSLWATASLILSPYNESASLVASSSLFRKRAGS